MLYSELLYVISQLTMNSYVATYTRNQLQDIYIYIYIYMHIPGGVI